MIMIKKDRVLLDSRRGLHSTSGFMKDRLLLDNTPMRELHSTSGFMMPQDHFPNKQCTVSCRYICSC